MRTGKVALYEDLKRHILTMELDPDELLDEAALTAQCVKYSSAWRGKGISRLWKNAAYG